MKYRKLTDLTNDEVRTIVTDIFHPKAIKNIKRHKRENYISFVITTEWYTDEKEEETTTIDDEIEFDENGFLNEPFQMDGDDFFKLKQFLLAKGCSQYLLDNPYLKEE